MPLDMDAVVADDYLKKIRDIVMSLPHMERGNICDDIVDFRSEMDKKYGNDK